MPSVKRFSGQTEMLYTLPQCAAFVGRHVTVLRKYYAAGLLPDPRHTKINEHQKTRLFTMQEMERMKRFFEGVQCGTIATIRKRVERKKRIDDAQNRF